MEISDEKSIQREQEDAIEDEQNGDYGDVLFMSIISYYSRDAV